MMSNGGSSHHFHSNNVSQQQQPSQPIPLSQIQPLMGTPSFQQHNSRRIYQQQHPPSIQRMMLETAYNPNNGGNGFSASSTSSSGSSGTPLIRGYFGGRKLYENVEKYACITCNEMMSSEQLSQLACGHRLCIQCLSMMGQVDKCPNCYAIGIFAGTHIREAFNSETSSPVFGISSGQGIGSGSHPTLSSAQSLKFNDFNIWEPLPLNQHRSSSVGQNEKILTTTQNLPKLFDNLNLISEKDNNNLKNQQQIQRCTNCDEKEIVTGFCVDCNEFLCAICIMAHERVKLTKDHQIRQLNEKNENFNNCIEHENLKYFLKCLTCNGLNLCIKCLSLHFGHSYQILQHQQQQQNSKILLKNLINDTKIIQELLQTNNENVKKMEENLKISIQNVKLEMMNIINLYLKTIDEKKNDLLTKIDKIYSIKNEILKKQNEKIVEKMIKMEKMIKFSEELLKNGKEKEIFECFENILKLHGENFLLFYPLTNDEIFFKLTNLTILNDLKNFGNIDSGFDPSSTCIIGNRYKNGISGRPFVINIQMKNILGEIITKESRENGGEFIATLFGPLNGPNTTMQHAEIIDRENGLCTLMFTPKNSGIYRLNISYCQISINGCPTEIIISSGRDYKDAQYQGQKFCFGKEGSGDGEFSRPWGICCDLQGRIIVADRSNHRIQIFDSRGKFLMKFGQKGIRPGDFNRPAGVCVNPSNNIIIADKDNHRIQIFFDDGKYSHGFGTRGCSTGCFNYPWGVATNSNYEIAVTDTRNHRIQLFTSTGIVLRTFMIDVGMKRSPSSPRGICFFPDNDLIISDFNTHRLAVVNKNGESRFYGLEGSAPGYFHRPQGIAIDPDGFILVCDSRSNRIQVLNLYDLTVVAVFGNDVKYSKIEPLSDSAAKLLDSNLFHQVQDDVGNYSEETVVNPGVNLLEHPMDVAVSPEGLVYVVDFGNNCIRVY